MPDTAVESAPPTVPPGPVTVNVPASAIPQRESLGQRVGDFFHRGEQDAEHILAAVPGFDAAIKAHAAQVFSVTSDVLAIAAIADPALLPALGPISLALSALEAKVLTMAASAAKMASAVTAASKTSA